VVYPYRSSEGYITFWPGTDDAVIRRWQAAPGGIAAALQGLKAEGGGSSQVPTRALVLAEPPSADGGEITDKGYINQGAVLKRRAAQVEALYAGGAGVVRSA